MYSTGHTTTCITCFGSRACRSIVSSSFIVSPGGGAFSTSRERRSGGSGSSRFDSATFPDSPVFSDPQAYLKETNLLGPRKLTSVSESSTDTVSLRGA